jgi:CheY-like chemotaxis protein
MTTARARLLIADDSPDMRRLIRSVLGGRFDEVLEAADGRELFWHLLHCSYQGDPRPVVLVADVFMPVYSGLDVLAACNELDFKVPTVVITSFPSQAVEDRVAELGGVLVAKPFATNDLRRVVDQVCPR